MNEKGSLSWLHQDCKELHYLQNEEELQSAFILFTLSNHNLKFYFLI